MIVWLSQIWSYMVSAGLRFVHVEHSNNNTVPFYFMFCFKFLFVLMLIPTFIASLYRKICTHYTTLFNNTNVQVLTYNYMHKKRLALQNLMMRVQIP